MNIVNFLPYEFITIDMLSMILVRPYLVRLFVFEFTVIFKYNFHPVATTFKRIINNFQKLLACVILKIANNITKTSCFTLSQKVYVVGHDYKGKQF